MRNPRTPAEWQQAVNAVERFVAECSEVAT